MEPTYSVISHVHPAEHSVTLMLAGNLAEEAVTELDRSITAALCARQRVYIDLSEVTLVDRKAAEYLSSRTSENVELVNCPMYLRRWVKAGER
jgi:ABC-type transporter Mla MlaB component